ncbi:MarC family protein [Psychromarinibacter sp. C21-152]|uniref:UPF0056 membrane protein n=1 Tax=Psychromarinibacter sediminicola TaxID=3033385 RepID=A0AAE3NT26_9RHOB|nr:MarC family protein [Psychromarinibacter sediminicola]MDF0600047.1 MarC family protein [Psychromarinibacter sediminicola]
MDPAQLVTAFVTLFVVIDPVGLSPLFVALTRGMLPPRRRAVALRAALTAVGLLTVFGLFGEALLAFVGISMPAFRIAGGILLFLTALDMLFDRRAKRREGQAHEQDDDPGDDPSVFPLGVPLTAGPGAMAAMILLVGQHENDWTWVVAIHLVMVSVIALCLLLWLAAGLMERALGPTGINVVTRLLGMLLAALSVQFVLDGLQGAGVPLLTAA